MFIFSSFSQLRQIIHKNSQILFDIELTRSPSAVSGKELHLLGNSPSVVRVGRVLMFILSLLQDHTANSRDLSEMFIGAG